MTFLVGYFSKLAFLFAPVVVFMMPNASSQSLFYPHLLSEEVETFVVYNDDNSTSKK